ncbi:MULTISPECIES: SDR family oxidoreductase [unclassified Nocardioides]|uniref:SDR family oxidoreductase n=1 Tax=unclassified Nocardioides TaxID=2615069 RepID=UPI000702692D|nr:MULTISPECIES: SDR family oxidoreductase [unclassified Nocardioides]KRC48712.1 NAD(P)-dependent oxidoreductase [Nocardioides sp. Root79]KRC75112.1 NAD(P)-dependent oxidoreductase [Nocardioides sp. Root240]
MSLVITGATGQLGRLVVSSLLAKGVPADQVVALGRDDERLAELGALGVTTRKVDYADAAGLADALTGADRVLLISGSEVGQRLPQHQNVIDAAKAAGVQLLAYTSIPQADTSGIALAAEHRATEEAITASGLPHTYLRNSWYIENYSGQLATYTEHGTVLGAAGDGQVSAATRADFAEAAAAALLLEQPKEVYELGGPAFSLKQLAATVSEVTGTDVTYTDVPAEELTKVLVGAGLPEAYAGILADADLGLGRGELYADPADLEQLLGRPATSLEDGLRAAR